MGEETEYITVAETSDDTGGSRSAGETVSLPVVELLTGRGFITGKSGSGKSILEGTPVYTDSGRKPIEQVENGERVLSLNRHTYEQELREVQATIEHTDDRLLRITLEDGTDLVGTADHSFLTADNLEIVPVRGDELEEGMWMPLARELPSPGSVGDIDLGEYVGDADNVVVDGGVIRSGPQTEERTRPLTFETGKEVGLYLAAGSLDSNTTVQITNVDDGVRQFLDSRGYTLYGATCSKAFQPYANFLESEFGRGSAGKRLPDWVFDAPEQFRAGLVSGYFDGDGTVEEGSVTAMSNSEALIAGLRELLRQFGISTTVRERLTVHDGEERSRLSVDSFCVERFREVVDPSVASKAEQLDALCDRLDEEEQFSSEDVIPNFGSVLDTAAREAGWTGRDSEQQVAGASVHSLTRRQRAGRETYNRLVSELGVGGRARLFGESDIQWKRVVSIEPLDEERTVYDLDVAGNDNFLANGVFVHNSNSGSVIAERLLDNEFGLLIVDIDGEYYGLKEEYEILHAGADEECDIQVTTDHAEKLAALALEQNVPIILDVSSYLDESEAEAMLTEVARSLFAKAKKQKQPFLLLVEEIHEYIPEQGSVGECGKMLIKIGKRGRKHGLGLCGISQRPADVKKDFITQCDWLLWHRLTWQNDTRVVRRILDGNYADAVENLDDGEGFLVTDWTGDVRRVQFYRKETFDAGATPGLEDVERPDLKSVSEDLVSELAEISDEASAREDRIAELESRLERREARIEELERELRDARDLRDLAEQFVEALTSHQRTGTGRPAAGTRDLTDSSGTGDTGGTVVTDSGATGDTGGTVVTDSSGTGDTGGTVVTDSGGTGDDQRRATEWPGGWRESEDSTPEDTVEAADVDTVDASDGTVADAPDETATGAPDETVADASDEAATGAPDGTVADASDETATGAPDETVADAPDETATGAPEDDVVGATDEEVAATVEAVDGESSAVLGGIDSGSATGGDDGERHVDAERAPKADTDEGVRDTGPEGEGASGSGSEDDEAGDSGPGYDTDERPFSADHILSRLDAAPGPGGDHSTGRTPREQFELEVYSDVEILDDQSAGAGGRADDSRAVDGGATAVDADPGTPAESGPAADGRSPDRDAGDAVTSMPEEEPLAVRELKAQLGGLETQTRRMLVFYREEGPASAQNAHFAAGGDGDRTQAYARNRTLRTRGFIGHVGRGRYDYRLREHLASELGDHVDEAVVDAYAADIERAVLGVS